MLMLLAIVSFLLVVASVFSDSPDTAALVGIYIYEVLFPSSISQLFLEAMLFYPYYSMTVSMFGGKMIVLVVGQRFCELLRLDGLVEGVDFKVSSSRILFGLFNVEYITYPPTDDGNVERSFGLEVKKSNPSMSIGKPREKWIRETLAMRRDRRRAMLQHDESNPLRRQSLAVNKRGSVAAANANANVAHTDVVVDTMVSLFERAQAWRKGEEEKARLSARLSDLMERDEK